jgi:hypothetical protein
VERLFDYWKTYPPLRDLVAAFIGFKPEVAGKQKNVTADDIKRLMTQFSSVKIPGLNRVSVAPAWPTPSASNSPPRSAR